MHYGRRIFAQIIALILCATILFGCNKSEEIDNSSLSGGFSAHVLDVGEGDAIFLHFPDGKNMLIDTGDKKDGICEYIVEYLKDYNVKTIDYLIITHPDSDHSGNALGLIDHFNIGRAYIPYIMDDLLEFYPTYKEFYQKINSLEIETKISDCYVTIVGEGYSIAFLSPYPKSFNYGSYKDFNAAICPSSEQSNALSPIIYVETYGRRMVFAGDAPKAQEIIAMQNASGNAAHYAYYGINVNLLDVDLLKISHHGADDASSQEFLSLLKPKNAAISVGANNIYGHPTRAALERIVLANPDCNIYRTDVLGTIRAIVKSDGSFEISTDAHK